MSKRFVRLLGTALAAAIGLAACGGDSPTSSGSGAQSSGTSAQPTLQTATSAFGDILSDPSGRTLYMFEPDKGGESACYGDCAKAWPALTVEDDPVAGTGVDESLLGTTERRNGSLQVTYGGLPLYYFAFDKKPGDINGQGSGDVWWVVSPQGSPTRR
jgi:predicted lipoprotein with Yx(FWY)xxD motif